MELGYNTDIVFAGQAFHVQTEGRLTTNPRIETLVYRQGVILHKLSVSDPSLAATGEGLEETKRKIRQQHLMAVAYAKRGELDRLGRIKDLARSQDPFSTLGDEARAFAQRLSKAGPKAFADRLLELAQGRILGEDRLAPVDEKLLLEALAGFNAHLADEETPFYRKQALVSALLALDSQDKMLDRYQALVAEEGSGFPSLDELGLHLRRCTNELIEILFQQSRKGSALADDFLLAIFTRQSLWLVRHLFEEAEKRFVMDRGNAQRNILPVVLLLLEDKFLGDPPNTKEVADILDRLNYLFARLDLETFAEIGGEVERLRQATDRASPFSAEQIEKVQVYKGLLETTVQEVRAGQTLAEKLAPVNKRREDIGGWERLLMLDVGLRLALKRYHNAVSEAFVAKAQALGAELAEAVAQRPSRGVRLLLRSLDTAIRDQENIGRIVGRALLAEGYLATLRRCDAEGTLTRTEVRAALERVTRMQGRSTAVIMGELGKLRMSRRDQILVARRLLEMTRLTRDVREDLESLVLTRYPSEVIHTAAERLREVGGPAPAMGSTMLEDAIEAEDGAWLALGGESGFEPEFEIGFEAAALQRIFFPGRSDTGSLLDAAMTGASFAFAEVKNRGGKPAFVFRYVVPRVKGKGAQAAEPPSTEAHMKRRQDGKAREALRSFEREVKALSANLEIKMHQLGKLAEDLGRIPHAIDAIKAHYRPLISSNRRLSDKVASFESVVRGAVEPLLNATRKAQSRGEEIAPLILSQMAADDKRRELQEVLSRLFANELQPGLGGFGKMRETLGEVLDEVLPRGSIEWDVIDFPKLQFLLTARNVPQTHVALLGAHLRINDRFYVDLKPRKAFRCRTEKIQRAVDGGLY